MIRTESHSNEQQSEKITFDLYSPLDMHVHFREGALLNKVAPLSARYFAGALVMPNLSQPLRRLKEILDYQQVIEEVVRPHIFKPYMTAYFNLDMDYDYLKNIKPHVLAIKFYPKGITTNSEHGVDPINPKILKVLEIMEELKIPLCVHGECDGFCMDREWLFGVIYNEWARLFPDLKVIMEHISDRRSLYTLTEHKNFFATITPQHAVLTLDAVVGDLLNPHVFCKPILKTPQDRDAIQDAVLGLNGMSGISHKLMLGTDSAPHQIDSKECSCGRAGVFNATVALKVIADIFMKRSTLDKFQTFTSDNAREIYGINPPIKKITFIKRDNIVPNNYGDDIIPMMAGQTLEWDIVD